MSKNVKPEAVIVPDEIVMQPPSLQQEAVIAALLEGKTQREAAALAGLAEETISRWKRNDPVFLGTLGQRRHEAWSLHLDAARKLKQKAVETLSDLLESGDDATRFKAAVVALRLDLVGPSEPGTIAQAIVTQAQMMTPEWALEQAKVERLKQEASLKQERIMALLTGAF